MGIRLGVLAGLAFVLFKVVQARRPARTPPGDEDPWARLPRREPEPAQPDLVTPTMLESVSVRDRPRVTTTPAPEAPAEVPAPTMEAAAEPAAATPPSAPAGAPEVEADDDEVVILSTGEEAPPPDVAPLPRPPAEEVLAEKATAKKAAARKAPRKQAAAKKAPAKKAPAKKGAARKAVAKKVTAAKKAAKEGAPSVAWVEPQGDVCPGSHPIKAKLRSGIFHLPGMAAYARTGPDRCYADEADAQADGLRRAAR